MDLRQILLLFAALVDLGLGLLVYFKTNPFRKVNFIFSILAWAAAGWALSFFMVYSLTSDASILFWGRMGFAASGILPTAFLFFAVLFPREKRKASSKYLGLFLVPLILCLGLSFTNKIVSSLGSDLNKMFVYGPFYSFFSIYLNFYFALGFVFLISTYRRTIGLERLRVKYCLTGMSVTTLLGLTANLFLPMAGVSTFNWLGPSFTVIMVCFTTYSIVKHRLMDINIVLKKGTTYALLLVLLYVPAFILILLAQKAFFQKVDTFFSVILLSIFFLVTLFFQKIKPGTERTVEQFLFKHRYDYRETLGRFSKAMVSILDLKSLLQKIIETITQTMKVEKASLFLWNEEKGGYELYESKNIKINSPPSHLSKRDPLPHYLQRIGEVIIREELMKGAHLPELNQVTEQMSSLEAEVSIPLTSKGQLVGIMNLSHKFDKDIYSQEDIDLLTTLANQTAIALENARLYEDLKKSKSYIRRADRLASLGTLTAGLAHEIRNPLTAIKTLTQLLPERLEDEEFRNEFLHIASGEVDRISSLVNELLEFARPSDPRFELEEINPILDGMILLTSTESKKKKIEIVKDYLQDLPPISIDREQIKQVFLNILLNAIEATPANGRIVVKTRSYLKPGGNPYLQVVIADNGSGIPKEFLEDIFNPFFTTKPKGSGLGLSISNQIVQDHDGYIHVESELNRGSSFFVNLPLTQDLVRPKRTKDDIESHPYY